MARRTRVVLNRSRLDEVSLAVADGFAALADAIMVEAASNAPDSPFEPYPTGEGLPKQGGYLVYVGGKKVASRGLDGREPKKPRAVKSSKHGIVGVVGFGFPGRFAEFGTIHHPAQPFFTPAVDRVTPRATAIMRPVVAARLKGR